jgi:hypothetical protein
MATSLNTPVPVHTRLHIFGVENVIVIMQIIPARWNVYRQPCTQFDFAIAVITNDIFLYLFFIYFIF